MQTFHKQLFYVEDADGGEIFVSGEEFVHLVKVFRIKAGDAVWVSNGKGMLFETKVSAVEKSRAVLEVIQTTYTEPQCLHELWISPLKNHDRLEWLVEKCTELGVYAIRFIVCAHTEKPQVNMQRLRKICVAAAKQSGNTRLPELHAPHPLFEVPMFSGETQIYVAHCRKEDMQDLMSLELKKSSAVLIGPEGDFSETEVAQLTSRGALEISLGRMKLRSETAGLKAAVWLSK
jgi:16S rRNA (uracil1498-N3)-methyltransferase